VKESIRSENGENNPEKKAGNDGQDFHGGDGESIAAKFNPESDEPMGLLARLIASLHESNVREVEDEASNSH
jgi:hypothetical protein